MKIRTVNLFFIVSALVCLQARGAQYYVSTNGNDSASGSLAAPWRTIQKAADVMTTGDTCYIRGGTYRETVNPANSGSAGNLITYTAYAGEVVTLNGCDVVGGSWSVDSGNVYKTTVAMNLGHENQVFVNGSDMVWEARWPNVGTTGLDGLLEYSMATMASGTSSTTIKNSSIPNYDWTGGSVWVSSYKRWYSWTGKVTGSASGQVSLVDNSESNHVCKQGGKFYIFGVRDALDSANEWYYDGSTLYLWAPDGGVPSGVEVKARVYGFDLSDRSFIRLENLNFQATGIKTSSGSASLEMDGLVVKHIYHSNKAENKYSSQLTTGLALYGTDHLLENSEIAYSSGTGVYLAGSGHRIINNYIHDHDYIGAYASPLYVNGSDLVVSHNTITRAGRQTIYMKSLFGSFLQYNDISHAGYLTWDLGLVYGNGIAGGNAEVRYNWFHDNLSPTHGKGIYYDHGCKNIITHHNVVWGISGEPLTNNQYGNYLLWYNNTGSTSGTKGIGSSWNGGMKRELNGCRYINNVVNKGTSFDATGYTLKNNFTYYTQLTDYRYLAAGTAPVDAAIPLDGITDSWSGDGPDGGAYEVGGEDWVPGHNFSSPPAFIDTTPALPRHRNLLINASFDKGTLAPWTAMGANTSLNQGSASQWTGDATVLMSGYSVKLGGGQSGVSQQITGLEPNTEYELMGKFRVEPGESAYLGVRDHGLAEVQRCENFTTDIPP